MTDISDVVEESGVCFITDISDIYVRSSDCYIADSTGAGA